MAFKVPEEFRVTNMPNYPFNSDASYGNNGMFLLPAKKNKREKMLCQASDAFGWEHVSVSLPNQKRTATWDEMCQVKDLFWGKEDTVIQYHPAEEDYVNNHPYVLHLWRYITGFPKPPKICV